MATALCGAKIAHRRQARCTHPVGWNTATCPAGHVPVNRPSPPAGVQTVTQARYATRAALADPMAVDPAAVGVNPWTVEQIEPGVDVRAAITCGRAHTPGPNVNAQGDPLHGLHEVSAADVGPVETAAVYDPAQDAYVSAPAALPDGWTLTRVYNNGWLVDQYAHPAGMTQPDGVSGPENGTVRRAGWPDEDGRYDPDDPHTRHEQSYALLRARQTPSIDLRTNDTAAVDRLRRRAAADGFVSVASQDHDSDTWTVRIARTETFGDLYDIDQIKADYAAVLPADEAATAAWALERMRNVSAAESISFRVVQMTRGQPPAVDPAGRLARNVQLGLAFGVDHRRTAGMLLGAPRFADQTQAMLAANRPRRRDRARNAMVDVAARMAPWTRRVGDAIAVAMNRLTPR